MLFQENKSELYIFQLFILFIATNLPILTKLDLITKVNTFNKI